MKILIVLLGIFGFLVSLYIYRKKNKKGVFSCLVQKHDCGVVVSSDYSKIFGIRLEILGMLYYGFIVLGFLFFSSTQKFVYFHFLMVCVTAFGAFFSFYLTAVQKWVIKKWCELCLGSAAASYSIFLLTIFLKT